MTAQQLLPGELLVTPQRVSDSVTVVALEGDLDMATTPSLVAALAMLDGAHSVVLDLDRLAFIDSHGIHALLSHAGTHRLIVARPCPNVARVLALTNARSAIHITDTLEAALAAGEDGRAV